MSVIESYYAALSDDQKVEFKRKLGVARAQLWLLRNGKDSIGPKMAVRIEAASGGAVTRQMMREDWREIWPELVSQAD